MHAWYCRSGQVPSIGEFTGPKGKTTSITWLNRLNINSSLNSYLRNAVLRLHQRSVCVAAAATEGCG